MDPGNFGGDFAALAIEDDGLVARFQAENIAGVMGFGSGRIEIVGVPLVRRDVEAMHG